jgi:hypothetical protein
VDLTIDSMVDLSIVHGMEMDIPSGNLLQFAIENGPVKIVDLPIKNGDVP